MKASRVISVLRRHLTVYTKLYLSSIALNFAEPVLYLAAFGIGLGAFVQQIDGMPYLNFIAPGIIASSATFGAVYECTYGTYVRMFFQKTFDAILATPVSLYELVAAELIWGALKSAFYGSIIMLVLALFGLLPSALILFAVPVLFLSGLLFASLAMIVAAIVPGIESFNYFYTLFMTPLFLFSGIFFPLTGLPPFVENIALLSPLHHLVTACRALAYGQTGGVFTDVLWITAALVLVIPWPFRLLRKKLIK
ncbi:MAG: lipooligosaccharide transport system permease protein [Nitrospirae bacterium]|nr:MAG: lipooligosaccharide transport system permease protein [Nitrospirota bacterium]